MVRELAFDICELAPVTYLMARAAGLPLTAIPVFLDRRFHHGDVSCAANSGIATPGQLEHRRVGVRAYSVSTGVWGRGLLAHEHGTDLSTITWVVDDEDHLPPARPPRIEHVRDGSTLAALLNNGRIDAAFGGNAGTGRAGTPRTDWARGAAANDPNARVYPLFADPDALANASYRASGIYPLHGVVVLRSELVHRDPELPSRLYAALRASKRAAVAADPDWRAIPHLERQRTIVGPDPLPYGVEPNAPTLATLPRWATEQGLLTESVGWGFAPGDYPVA